jgi:mannose-6-phosphate isomerase-like protein (cupin superfamily)
MELPTKTHRPDRKFQEQLFCHHKLREAVWKPWRIENFESRDTGIQEATNGVASVQIARTLNTRNSPKLVSHNTDILFTFVMQGHMELKVGDEQFQQLKMGDAFVIPTDLIYSYSNCSSDLELLEVSLPGKFKTTTHL